MDVDPALETGIASPPRILVVEDDVLVRALISIILRDMGVIVDEAADADEAWVFLEAGYPVDLVFTDYRMPGSMNGVELARRIKAEHPRVDVVLVSGTWQGVEWTEPIIRKPYPLEQTAIDLARRALIARKRE